jgi:hypothetical protein
MVGGTAYAVGKHAQRGQQAEADQEARLEQLEAQQAQAAPAPAPVSAGGPTDLASKLTQLKALLDQGALTPDEYATAKAQLLAGG